LASTVIAAPLVLAACGGSSNPTTASAPAEDEVLAAALKAEQEIIALYDAVIANPDTVGAAVELLRAIRDQHAEHAAAFGGDAGEASAPAIDAGGALRALIRAEKGVRASHAAAAATAGSADLVRLLTVVAASESMHAGSLKKAR